MPIKLTVYCLNCDREADLVIKKGDGSTLPLCRQCHDAFQMGQAAPDAVTWHVIEKG